jgi:phosphate transport system substrate-binding protein
MLQLLTLVVLAIECTLAIPASAQQLKGSGSTFVYPVMAEWVAAYEKISGAQITYGPIGSSGGIKDIKAGAVDFGVSDAPLLSEELSHDHLAQFPVVIGGIVPIVNLDAVPPGQIRFTGQLLADIYLGKIRRWNDPAIAAVNPAMDLPSQPITVMYRSDGSGTTFNWVDYVSKSSSEWRVRVGEGTSVGWPIGFGGKGNSGVADNVTHVKGAIGYVEFAYVLQRKLVYGLVRNRAGNFVQPSAASFQAATRGVDWEKSHDFYVILNDAPGENAYPIVATSFVLMPKQTGDALRTRDALAFFKWSLEKGQDIADALSSVPLSADLVRQVESYWGTEIAPGRDLDRR